jgi:hypothetical protein
MCALPIPSSASSHHEAEDYIIHPLADTAGAEGFVEMFQDLMELRTSIWCNGLLVLAGLGDVVMLSEIKNNTRELSGAGKRRSTGANN